MNITLNTCQQAAVDEFLKFLMSPTQTELVISGYAGTGKTTLVQHLLDQMPRFETAAAALGSNLKCINEVAVTATTRKAASVIADMLGVEATTVHSYLGLILRNDYQTGETYLQLSKNAKPASNTLIFVDEASFINSELLSNIRQQTPNCKVVYMGDPCQLISVNSSQSPIFDGKIPTVKLTTVMRNDGAIDALSAQYRDTVLSGIFRPIKLDNKKVVHVTGDVFKSMIDAAFTDKDYKPDDSAKVLAWTNSRVLDYNNYIAQVRGCTARFSPGETLINNSVIISKKTNDILASTDQRVVVKTVEPEVQHGIEGWLVTLRNIGQVFVPESQFEKTQLLKRLSKSKNWKDYFNIKDTWADLRPAYAATVHKSQGSTYDRVFVDLSDIGSNNVSDEVARLLYVAISRASSQVILYGELPDKYLGKFNVTVKEVLSL